MHRTLLTVALFLVAVPAVFAQTGETSGSLAALDEDKRLVFTLKVLHQCSYEEIAAITGFSLAKLKTDLHRARAEMRKKISPYAGVGYEV